MNSTRIRQQAIFLLLACIAGLAGCRADVDLNNIDARMQAEMGLALPVGNMLFTVNDFLGGGQVSKISLDSSGVFHFIDTINIPAKNYHHIDPSQFASGTKEFTVKSQLTQYLDPTGKIADDKKGKEITLTFPTTITLKNVNQNPSEERLDSIRVAQASFIGKVYVSNFALQAGWINSIDLVLNKKQFIRAERYTIPIYTKETGYYYGKETEASVNQFTLSLMDSQSPSGVVDTCHVTFIFKFTIPTNGGDVYITDQSAFKYEYTTKSVNFDAAWGFFQGSKEVRDRSKLCIDSLWEDWKNMKKMQVKLMEPLVTVVARHHIAAPLLITLDTLMASNAEQRVSAMWGGKTYKHFPLKNYLPLESGLNDSVENTQRFTHHPDSGQLSQLFAIRPDTLYYSFAMKIDPNPSSSYWTTKKQHRITSNTRVNGHAVVDIPFKVNKESEVNYLTKISDVNFQRIRLDSLLQSVKAVEKSNAEHIKLFLRMENSLPFRVNARVWFLRQDGTEMNLHLFDGMEQNEVSLPAPKMAPSTVAGDPYGTVREPSVTTFIVDVDQQQFDQLTQCKQLKVDAYMGSNPEPCKISASTSVTVYLGVAANVKAIINPNK